MCEHPGNLLDTVVSAEEIDMSESLETTSVGASMRWVFFLSGEMVHRENPHCGCGRKKKF
jgi:hypothetical protein